MRFKQFIEMRLTSQDEPESSKEFVSKLLNIGYRNPLNPKEIVINNEAAVEINAFNGMIWLKTIRSFTHKQGAGTRTMKLLCNLADITKSTLNLEAVPYGNKG